MFTYQDFLMEKINDESAAIQTAINEWKSSELYRTAILANSYDRQKNDTITNYIKTIFSLTGSKIYDFTASNNKITSNFFRRLNTQRNTYSLGNGVYFEKDNIKEQFGKKFDTTLLNAAYKSLIHGVSFPFWNGKLYFFEATEFVPLWDEETSELKAGIRFWQIDANKPMYAVVYENDGYAKWKKEKGSSFELIEEKKAYILTVQYTEADGVEVVASNNYISLPIIPLWGNSLHQSTLVGLQSQIDSYDLIRSGFANDLTDVAQIYWIIENYGGMTDTDLARFRDRLKLNHIVEADTSEGGKITPYSQDIPYQARKIYLDSIRDSMYEDFGGLDVHTIAAGATNDHIDAAYQPLDENADDFEAQIIEFVQQLGALIGIDEEDCIPIFKRNRISNHSQLVEMVIQSAEWLDDETILKKLPFITVDEVESILKRKDEEEMARFSLGKEGDE